MQKKFMDFEQAEDLLNKEVSGVNFWHLVRFNIYNEIIREVNTLAPAHKKNNESKKSLVFTKIKNLKYLFINNPFVNLKKKDILYINHPRKVFDGGAYKCLYTSDIIENLDKSYYVYERPYNDRHFTPATEDEIKFSDAIDFKYQYSKFFNKIVGKSQLNMEEKSQLKILINKLNEEFDVHLSIKKWINFIDNRLLAYKIYYNSFYKILQQINPKVIFEVVSYSGFAFEVNAVAKELKIPTIELQHGIIGSQHIAYNFNDKVELSTFPDYIFTFGDYWNENTNFPLSENRVKSVGWSYYNQERRDNLELSKKNRIKNILFISQGPIGEQLSKIAVKLLDSINSDEYKIIYKLHPGEFNGWKIQYPWLAESNITVVDDNQKDMHYYFAIADVQIGVYSTALYEGLGYGLETFIVELYGHNLMIDLLQENYAELISDEDDIVKKLLSTDTSSIEFNTEYFWKQNSINHLIRETEEIIKKVSDE